MFLKLNDCLCVFVGGALFVVLQGSAEVMEDDEWMDDDHTPWGLNKSSVSSVCVKCC